MNALNHQPVEPIFRRALAKESMDTASTDIEALDPRLELERALRVALGQYRETMGEEFPANSRVEVVNDPNFWASVELDGPELLIKATTGLVKTMTELWTKALSEPDFTATDKTPLMASVNDMVHLGLVWLMLHELHHFEMGHFGMLGQFRLTEAKEGNCFDLVSRATKELPRRLRGLEPDELELVEPCLEMQADHDAIEMLLDAYSSEGWDALRIRAIAIAAMMVIIEREDSKLGHKVSSHPKAATRIFQLIGHLVDMPFVSKNLGQELQKTDTKPEPLVPSPLRSFIEFVAFPSFRDASNLAAPLSESRIKADLGNADVFFEDVSSAKLEPIESEATFTTAGAKGWFALKRLNEKIQRGP